MTNNDLTLMLTITAMGVVTYFTRISGFFISSRIQTLPETLERFLKYIPGTIIVSIIAPQMAQGGSLTLSASALCILVSLWAKNLVVVMAAGVVYVSMIRQIF